MSLQILKQSFQFSQTPVSFFQKRRQRHLRTTRRALSWKEARKEKKWGRTPPPLSVFLAECPTILTRLLSCQAASPLPSWVLVPNSRLSSAFPECHPTYFTVTRWALQERRLLQAETFPLFSLISACLRRQLICIFTHKQVLWTSVREACKVNRPPLQWKGNSVQWVLIWARWMQNFLRTNYISSFHARLAIKNFYKVIHRSFVKNL